MNKYPVIPNGLNMYKQIIAAMAKAKKFSDDPAWLQLGVFKEMGEVVQAIEHGKSQKKIAKEISDVVIFLFQVANKHCPDESLDNVVLEKIKHNMTTKKKTYKNGRIIRR